MASINMPGPRANVIGGLADILNTYNTLKTGSAQRGLIEQEKNQKDIAAQQGAQELTQKQNQLKTLSDPTSVASQGINAFGKADLSFVLQRLGADPTQGPVSNFLQRLDEPAYIEAPAQKDQNGNIIQGAGQKVPNPNAVSGLETQQFLNSAEVKQAHDLVGNIAKAEAMGQAAKIRVGPQNVRNESDANKQYKSEIVPFENAITSSNRVLGIIDKIKSGELMSTPTLATDLGAAMGQAFNNGKAATVYQQSHANIGTAEGNFNSKYGYILSKPVNTIPQPILDQMQKDFVALRDEYSEARSNNYNSFKEGLDPSLRGNLDRRFGSFSNSTLSRKFGNEKPSGNTAPALDADLSKMTDQQLQDYIKTHGGK